MKNTHGGVLLLLKLQAETCKFTKSKTPPWVLFTFFKLHKWYQIAQRIKCKKIADHLWATIIKKKTKKLVNCLFLMVVNIWQKSKNPIESIILRYMGLLQNAREPLNCWDIFGHSGKAQKSPYIQRPNHPSRKTFL